MNIYLKFLVVVSTTMCGAFQENDYRQGVDFNIFNIHIINVTYTYLFFIVLMCANVFYLLRLYPGTIFIHISSYIASLTSFFVLVTGAAWGWSQWGSIEMYDLKILVVTLLFLMFLTTYLIMRNRKTMPTPLFLYNVYILYHIPLLKYNVLWSSEIHQKNSFYLAEHYVVGFNGINLVLLGLLTVACTVVVAGVKWKVVNLKEYL